jgi:hypothetical protein
VGPLWGDCDCYSATLQCLSRRSVDDHASTLVSLRFRHRRGSLGQSPLKLPQEFRQQGTFLLA